MLRRVAPFACCLVAFVVLWPVCPGVDRGTLDEFRSSVTAPAAPLVDAVATKNDAPASPAAAAPLADIAIKDEAPAAQSPSEPQQAAAMQSAALESVTPAAPVPPAPIAPPPAAVPFGLTVLPITGGGLWHKWTGVEAQIRAEAAILARCGDDVAHCPDAARRFLAIIAQGRAANGRARIGVINRAVNLAIEPMSDLAQWGVVDRWSPPLETFATGRGDCEDYAIAKYVALTAAGVAAEDVKLVVVRNLAVNEDHAVVAVHLDGDWMVLDNRWLTLVKDVEMPKIVPLFVLDEAGVRQFAAPAVAAAASPASF